MGTSHHSALIKLAAIDYVCVHNTNCSMSKDQCPSWPNGVELLSIYDCVYHCILHVGVPRVGGFEEGRPPALNHESTGPQGRLSRRIDSSC